MRILITTTGSSGDINPFIAIGIALARRGHDVLVLTNPHAESKIQAAGLGFQSFGLKTNLPELVATPNFMDARKGPQTVWNELVASEIPHMIEALHVAFDEFRPDIAVSYQLFVGTQWMCKLHGIPSVQAMISPRIWMSSDDNSVFYPWEPRNPPRVYTRIQHACVKALLRRFVDPDVNRGRRICGLPEQPDAFQRVIWDADLALGLWSHHFRPPMRDDPANGRICGFCWNDRHDDQESDASEVRDFLEAGEPPIVFCLGSTAAHIAGDFYRHAAEACLSLGRRALLLTGQQNNSEYDCLDGVRAGAYAPLSIVAAAGCATVHHGGIGTTAHAMRAGRPTVIVPFAHDQFDNAARASKLGVSHTLKRKRVSASTLARSLCRILTEASYTTRAVALGRCLTNEDGASSAADHLESLLMRSRRTTVFSRVRTAQFQRARAKTGGNSTRFS